MRPNHSATWALLGAALLISGCGVDRAGLALADVGAGGDGGPLEVGVRDLAMRDLGALDLGQDDLGQVDFGGDDLGQEDLGPPDLGPPDLGPPDLGPPPSCDSLYRTASAYQLCAELPTECEIYTDFGASVGCNALCGSLGGVCTRAFPDDIGPSGDMLCGGGPGTVADCATDYGDAICVCSR